jgi:hypothetical protein
MPGGRIISYHELIAGVSPTALQTMLLTLTASVNWLASIVTFDPHARAIKR